MNNEGTPIVKEGVPILLVCLAAGIASWILGWVWLSLLFFLLGSFVAFFFRNPERLPPVGKFLLASPADGKVIFLGEVTEPEFLRQKMLKISIFMSIFDVHVNRVPIDATVKDIRYRRGRFLAAFEDHASDENERNALLLETPFGASVVLVQVAGLIARRIHCYPAIGSYVLKGQRLGVIRFGSRCDIYLPLGSSAKVQLGEKVFGAETVVAELPQESRGKA